jgi:preprotein translocase subunit SecD
MKEIRLRLFIIIAALILSVYLLYPTYVDYQKSKDLNKVLALKKQELLRSNSNISPDQLDKKLAQTEDSVRASDPSYIKARAQRIKLGLDLQGGMRIVLEVNTSKLINKVAKNPDDVFKQVIAESDKESSISDEAVVDIFARKLKARGIRLSRYFGSVRDDDNKIIADLKKDAEDAVTRAMEIIRNRVDQYGVSEPSIQQQGSRRIIVELPGVAREEEAKQLLQGTALLEFKLLKEPDFTFSVMQKIDNVLAGKTLVDSTKSDSLAAADTNKSKTNLAKTDTSAEQKQKDIEKNHPFFAIAHLLDSQGRSADAAVRGDERDKLTRLLNRPDVQNVIPNNVEFIYSAKPFKNTNDNKDYYTLYLVNKDAELTGGVITNARANIDPTTSSAVVDMEMNSDGASEWSRITGANIHKRIAIVLDGVAFSAPVVQGKIPSGRSQISGMGNMEEAKLLEIILKAGALPAPVDIIEQRTIGPSLGQDSVNSGLASMIISYLTIGLFMVIYYKRAGDVAAAMLVLVVLFIFAVLAGFGATLTLPGMAGIVLTMGMAVDANVLIYERIREELGVGKTVKASVESGFSKAMPAIIDTHITTFLTGIILYQFGTGPVQGFALTLMIGIISTLFGALVIARVIFDWMVAKGLKINVG